MDLHDILKMSKQCFPPIKKSQSNVNLTFSEEAVKLTSSIFKQWFINKSTDNSNTGSDDDLLFFVRNSVGEGESKVDVARKDSSSLPSVADEKFNWPETFFLNFILHEFEYQVTVAVCTVHHMINVLRRKSLQVFPSPTKQRMDRKSKESETIYPDLFFSIDDFEQCFRDILIQHEGEKIAVELVAKNEAIGLTKLVFSGMVDYSAVQQAFFNREKAQSTTTSLATKIASFTPFKNRIQSFNVEQAAQYIRLRGPRKTGFAELAVSKYVPPETLVTGGRKASQGNDIASQNVSVRAYRKVSSSDDLPQSAQPVVTQSVPEQPLLKKPSPSDQVLNASLTYVMLHWQTIVDAVLYSEEEGKLSS